MGWVNTSPSLHLGHLAFKTLDKTDLSIVYFTVAKPKNDDDKNKDIGCEKQKHNSVVQPFC